MIKAIRLTMVFAVLGGLCWAGLQPTASWAQERQIAFDRDETVYVLTKDLRDAIDAFPDVRGFQEARAFRDSSGAAFAEIIATRDGVRRRMERDLSEDELASIRDRVEQVLQQREVEQVRRPAGSGETRFVGTLSVLAGIEGVLLTIAGDWDDEAAISVPMFLAGSGFFLPFVIGDTKAITPAQATMTAYGGLQGGSIGYQLAYSLDAGMSVQGSSAIAALTLPAGAIGGAYIAGRQNWTKGHAEMVAVTGLSGNFLGWGLGEMAIGDAGSTEGRVASSLAGAVGGITVGHLMGRTDRYTTGDARVYGLAGLTLTNMALSFTALGDGASRRTFATVGTLAGLSGLGTGALMVRGLNFSERDANLIWLGASSGSLLAQAIAVNVQDPDSPPVIQSVGTALGLGITYALFRDDARRSIQDADSQGGGIDIDFRITPIFGAASVPGVPRVWQRPSEGRSTLRPVANLRLRF